MKSVLLYFEISEMLGLFIQDYEVDICCHLFGKKKNQWSGETEIAHVLVHSPNACNNQGQARSSELHPHLAQGWQGPKDLDHHPLPPRIHQQEAGLEVKEEKSSAQDGISVPRDGIAESYFRSLFGVSGQNFPAGMVGSVFILPHLEFTQNQWDIVGKNALKY